MTQLRFLFCNKSVPRTHRQQGATLVEFALSFPILILLITSVIYLGNRTYSRIIINYALTKAAREASLGRLHSNTPQKSLSNFKQLAINNASKYRVRIAENDLTICPIQFTPCSDKNNPSYDPLGVGRSIINVTATTSTTGSINFTYINENF